DFTILSRLASGDLLICAKHLFVVAMAVCQTLALTDARYHSGNRAELVPLWGHIMPCMGPLAAEGDDWTPIVSGGSEEVVGEVRMTDLAPLASVGAFSLQAQPSKVKKMCRSHPVAMSVHNTLVPSNSCTLMCLSRPGSRAFNEITLTTSFSRDTK